MFTVSWSGTRGEPRICHAAPSCRRRVQAAAVPADDLLVLVRDVRPGPTRLISLPHHVDELREPAAMSVAARAGSGVASSSAPGQATTAVHGSSALDGDVLVGA